MNTQQIVDELAALAPAALRAVLAAVLPSFPADALVSLAEAVAIPTERLGCSAR